MAGKRLTTNAGQKKTRGGNNNPTGKGKFTGADDPRRNNAGQRSAAVVAFSKEIRSIISEVGNEEITTDKGQRLTRIEGAVRGMYQAATKGNVQAFTALVERVEGKIAQKIDLSTMTNDQLLAALSAADSSLIEG